jgi:hypothetical protein
MFGDHIALAMARERQRDLVPELRTLKRERSASGIDDVKANGARAISPEPQPTSRAQSRFARARARRATGRNQTGQQAGQPLETPTGRTH